MSALVPALLQPDEEKGGKYENNEGSAWLPENKLGIRREISGMLRMSFPVTGHI